MKNIKDFLVLWVVFFVLLSLVAITAGCGSDSQTPGFNHTIHDCPATIDCGPPINPRPIKP